MALRWLCGAVIVLGVMGCESDSPADASADAGDAGKLVWKPEHPEVYDGGNGGAASDASITMRDASSLEGRGCAMTRERLPDSLLPRCKASTRTCIADCMTAANPDDCRGACLKADDTPAAGFGTNCESCVLLTLFACIDEAGCHEGVAQSFCCFEDRCPAPSADGCTEERCGTELNDAFTCGYYANVGCLDFLGEELSGCFADAPDAGN